MSFLGFGQPQPTSAQKIAAAKQELEMVTDMFNRYLAPPPPPNIPDNERSTRYGTMVQVLTNFFSLTQSCYKKCIPPSYQESELNKGESVCLDRCVSKFFDVNNKVPPPIVTPPRSRAKVSNKFFKKVTEKMQSLQGQAMGGGRAGGFGA